MIDDTVTEMGVCSDRRSGPYRGQHSVSAPSTATVTAFDDFSNSSGPDGAPHSKPVGDIAIVGPPRLRAVLRVGMEYSSRAMTPEFLGGL